MEKAKIFLPKVVPRWRPLSSTRDHKLSWKSSEHIQWAFSGGGPLLLSDDVLWDLLYIFHWKFVNRTILLSLQNIVTPLPSAPRLSNYTLQWNIIHYYVLQSVWDFFIYLHLSDRVRASIIPSNDDSSVGPPLDARFRTTSSYRTLRTIFWHSQISILHAWHRRTDRPHPNVLAVGRSHILFLSFPRLKRSIGEISNVQQPVSFYVQVVKETI